MKIEERAIPSGLENKYPASGHRLNIAQVIGKAISEINKIREYQIKGYNIFGTELKKNTEDQVPPFC